MKLQTSPEQQRTPFKSYSRNLLIAAGLLLQSCGLDSSDAGATQLHQNPKISVLESELAPYNPSTSVTALSSIDAPLKVEAGATADRITLETTENPPKGRFEIVPTPTLNELFTAEKDYVSWYHKIEPATIWYGEEQHQKYLLYVSPIDYRTKGLK